MPTTDEELLGFIHDLKVQGGWHLEKKYSDGVFSIPFKNKNEARDCAQAFIDTLGIAVKFKIIEEKRKATFKGKINLVKRKDNIVESYYQVKFNKQDISLEYEKRKERSTQFKSDLKQKRVGQEVRVPAVLSRGGKAEGLLKREHYMLTLRQINFVRRMQLEQAFKNPQKKATDMVLSHENYPNIFGTQDPAVLIGKNGEAVMLCEQAKLGSGARGAIYIGQNLDTGDFCVVKKLKDLDTAQGDTQEDAQEEFEIETHHLEDLNQLIDTQAVIHQGKTNLYSAINMAWGKNYNDELGIDEHNNVKYDFLSRVDMFIKALEEIHDLHVKKNKLHGDIKAENIMWDKQNKVAKLVDFGMAKNMDSDGKAFGYLEGTPIYIAPEVWKDKNEKRLYTKATDTYSAGILGCEIFSGQDLALSPLRMYNAVLQNKNTEGPLTLLQNLDIFTTSTSTEQQLFSEIKKMIDVNSKNRPSLENTIQNLKKIQKKLHAEKMIRLPQAEKTLPPAEIESGIKKNSMEKYIEEQKIINKQLHSHINQLIVWAEDLSQKLTVSLNKKPFIHAFQNNEIKKEINLIEQLMKILIETDHKQFLSSTDLEALGEKMITLNVNEHKRSLFNKLFYNKSSATTDLINQATNLTSSLIKLTKEYEVGITAKTPRSKNK